MRIFHELKGRNMSQCCTAYCTEAVKHSLILMAGIVSLSPASQDMALVEVRQSLHPVQLFDVHPPPRRTWFRSRMTSRETDKACVKQLQQQEARSLQYEANNEGPPLASGRNEELVASCPAVQMFIARLGGGTGWGCNGLWQGG